MRDERDAALADARRLGELLQHLREYWNGSENQTAMADALHHIESEIDAAMKGGTMPNADQLRAEFEADDRARYPGVGDDHMRRFATGSYKWSPLQQRYEAWQAAGRARAKRDAEICYDIGNLKAEKLAWECGLEIEKDAGL
jgi:hypothetical protein